MTKDETVTLIKNNLKITDDTKDLMILDMVQNVLNYCNLKELPDELEPFVRMKVKSIIDYETENGSNTVFDIKSIREGDTSITYNVDDKTSKETIYGLSKHNRAYLNMFRRTRK